MNTRQIENILAIEREGSISRAAESLFLTQSALNQQLLKLEGELGVPLFYRRRHGMVPTDAGRVYLDAGRRMLELKSETYKVIQDIREETAGELSIAYTPERGARIFAEIYPRFHERYPKVIVRPREARVKQIDQLLLRNEVSMAVTSYDEASRLPDLEYHDIRTEEIVLGLAAGHPLAAEGGSCSAPGHKAAAANTPALPLLDLRLLREERFILESRETRLRDIISLAFRHAQYTPEILLETVSTQTVVHMVASGIGPGFFPQSFADPSLPVSYFSVEPHPRWTLGIAHRKDIYLSRPERAMMKLIEDHLQ